MKFVLLFCLCILAGTSSVARADESLEKYYGYWIQVGAPRENVLFVDSTYEGEDKGDIYRAKGIDLLPDFGYPSVAGADGDRLELQFNPDRNITEAIFEKTLDGEKQLMEFAFSLDEKNTLQIAVKTKRKSVVFKFTHAADWLASEARFNAIQKKRTRELLDANLNTKDLKTCNATSLSWYAEHSNFACVKEVLEHGKPYQGDVELLMHSAIKGGDPKVVRYLIQKKLPFDQPDQWGHTPLQSMFLRGSTWSQSTVGEHGWVSTSFEQDDVRKLLIESGADFNRKEKSSSRPKTPFCELVNTGGNADFLNLMLDRGAHLKSCGHYSEAPWLSFFLYSQKRWGSQSVALFDRLYKQGGIDFYAMHGDHSGGFLPYVMRDGDISALKLLKSYGLSFREWEKRNGGLIGRTLSDLAQIQADLKSPYNSTPHERNQVLQHIAAIEANIAYVKAQMASE